jgi:large subunit ribosomal protein L21
MYAIIATGGKQYKVEENQLLDVEKLPQEKDQEVVFSQVLLIADKDAVKIGQPYLHGAYVTGKVMEQMLSDKLIIFKFKKKTGYMKKQGHRQPFSRVKIEKINMEGWVAPVEAPKAEPVMKKQEAKAIEQLVEGVISHPSEEKAKKKAVHHKKETTAKKTEHKTHTTHAAHKEHKTTKAHKKPKGDK